MNFNKFNPFAGAAVTAAAAAVAGAPIIDVVVADAPWYKKITLIEVGAVVAVVGAAAYFGLKMLGSGGAVEAIAEATDAVADAAAEVTAS